jgi:hypothetical protein
MSPDKQLQRTVHGIACATHVRHFIVHTRRAGHVVARPLNCGDRYA